MGIIIRESLTVNNIMKLTNEYDIFRTYCLPFKEAGKFFKSELREDNNPTCKIFLNEHDALIYHDFNGNSHNCFTYIVYKYNIDFNTALNIINRDFKLGLSSSWSDDTNHDEIAPKKYDKKKLKHQTVTILQKRKRKWSKLDKEYWFNKYSISSFTLNYFNVEPIEYYWVNYRRFKCHNITYSYEFNGARDIYAPLNEEYKWAASTTKANKHIYGLTQLAKSGDVLFVVSSLKEVMFLFELGINAIAPQSESCFIPDSILTALRLRFDRIIIMYDFDRAGCIQALKWATKYDLGYMKFCPVMISYYQAKDLTDAYEINNDKIIKLILNYEKYI